MGGGNRIKHWEITFPRTALPKEDFGNFLVSLNPEEVIVSQEVHKEEAKEGQPPTHLHAYMHHTLGFTKNQFLNHLKAKYGEYEVNRIKVGGCRNMTAWKQYIIKDDEKYFYWNRRGTNFTTDRNVMSVRDVLRMRFGSNIDLSVYTPRELNMTWAEHTSEINKVWEPRPRRNYWSEWRSIAYLPDPDFPDFEIRNLEIPDFQEWYHLNQFP